LGKTVRELESEMTMSEVNNWIAYFEIIKESQEGSKQ